MTSSAAGTARSSAPLSAAWFLTAVTVGPVGFLLFALAEASGDRLVGLALVGAGVLAAVAGAAALASGDAVRPWSLGLSGLLVVLGVVAAGIALTGPGSFVADALLLGLPPVLGGLLTGALALRR